MDEFLNYLIDFLNTRPDAIVYSLLFISAVMENLLPPIPGDTITAFGAFMVGTGRLNYLMVYLSTTLGSVFGFMSLFWLGRVLEKKFFEEKDISFFSKDRIYRAEQWFFRHGYYIVLANRFLPGIRSVISIVSGFSGLGTRRVFFFALASAAAWNLIWIHAGYMIGTGWEAAKERLDDLMRGYNCTAAAVLLVVFIYLLYRYWKKKKRKA